MLFRALSTVDFAPLLAVTLVALMTASVPLSVFGVDVSDGSIVVLAGLLGVEASAALVVVALLLFALRLRTGTHRGRAAGFHAGSEPNS